MGGKTRRLLDLSARVTPPAGGGAGVGGFGVLTSRVTSPVVFCQGGFPRRDSEHARQVFSQRMILNATPRQVQGTGAK